ncbi:GGDEF domain-containing protein [Desulfonema magnum]|uniref:diguanylate cyclase n=1 Tax=Desulfonema magnum TaxID=45655 RepID=A0A975BJS4_9BACT|nr:GGDEF domain-containing protein [Desulfonema magnum]
MKHKIAIMLFFILIIPEIFTLYLLETGQISKLICYTSLGLSVSVGLVIPLANALAYVIVLREIREMNGFCQRIRMGKYDFFFDLPNEEEEESEMIQLKRNMNWMLRVISNRSNFLRSQLLASEKTGAEFKDLSLKDSLTHLYNRRCFDAKIKELAENARESGHAFFLILIDVDEFKQINDKFGHQAGDELLIRLGRILMDSTRKGTDFPFRYGGDEFGVIVSETCLEKVLEIAARIWCRYKKGALGDSTLSIGVAEFICGHGNIEKDIRTLIKAADDAVYQSKNTGRKKIIVNDAQTKQVITLPNQCLETKLEELGKPASEKEFKLANRR